MVLHSISWEYGKSIGGKVGDPEELQHELVLMPALGLAAKPTHASALYTGKFYLATTATTAPLREPLG